MHIKTHFKRFIILILLLLFFVSLFKLSNRHELKTLSKSSNKILYLSVHSGAIDGVELRRFKLNNTIKNLNIYAE